MARACSVCMHPQRKLINKALGGNVPMRQLAVHYGVSMSALSRHGKHVRAVAAGQMKTLASQGGTMVQRFLGMLDESVKQYAAAKTSLEKVQWFREQRGVWQLGIQLGYQQQQDKQEYKGCDPSVLALVRDLVDLPTPGGAPALPSPTKDTDADAQADDAQQDAQQAGKR